jgi:tmRNA-binding protein
MEGIKIIANNKKARFEYFIDEITEVTQNKKIEFPQKGMEVI